MFVVGGFWTADPNRLLPWHSRRGHYGGRLYDPGSDIYHTLCCCDWLVSTREQVSDEIINTYNQVVVVSAFLPLVRFGCFWGSATISFECFKIKFVILKNLFFYTIQVITTDITSIASVLA